MSGPAHNSKAPLQSMYDDGAWNVNVPRCDHPELRGASWLPGEVLETVVRWKIIGCQKIPESKKYLFLILLMGDKFQKDTSINKKSSGTFSVWVPELFKINLWIFLKLYIY
jgi:hypothetical protein